MTSLLQYTGFLDYNKCSPDELDLTASESTYNTEYPGVFRLRLRVEGFRGNPVFLSQARQNSTTHQERQEATQGAGLVLQKNKHFKSGCCHGRMPVSAVNDSFKFKSDKF